MVLRTFSAPDVIVDGGPGARVLYYRPLSVRFRMFTATARHF
jgi:hypothetical protein